MRAHSSSFAALVAVAVLTPALALAADAKPQATPTKPVTSQVKPQAVSTKPAAASAKPATSPMKPASAAHPAAQHASTTGGAGTQAAHSTLAPSTMPTVAKTDADVSLSGQIVDLASYMSYQEPGTDRAQYAQSCSKSNEPIALMADDGMLYVLTANHMDPAAFTQARGMAGEKVTVTGAKHMRGALNGLEVHGVKAATAHS